MITAKNEAILHLLSEFFLIFGGLVWGVLGMTGYNLISRSARMIGVPTLTRVIYLMIGLAAGLMLMRFIYRTRSCLVGETNVSTYI